MVYPLSHLKVGIPIGVLARVVSPTSRWSLPPKLVEMSFLAPASVPVVVISSGAPPAETMSEDLLNVVDSSV